MSEPVDFPLPYPNQLPDEDLASARLMLEAVAFGMESCDALSSARVQSLFFVLCAAMEKLEVIQLLLDDCDHPEMENEYRAARRTWIVQKGGQQ